MKFSVMPVTFLLVIILAAFAGCTSTPSSPAGTPATSADPKPWEVGTPVPYTELPQLLLLPSEIPFAIVGQQGDVRDMTDPAFSRFGATRGITRYVINENAESNTSIQLGQTIVEYPRGNATKAFTAFIAENGNSDILYNITVTNELGIGERSSALIIRERTGTSKPLIILVFVKSNIMETIILMSPEPDLNTTIRVAKFAAAKIP